MNSFDLFGNPTKATTLTDAPSSPASFSLDPDSLSEQVEDEKQAIRHFPGLSIFVLTVITALATQTFRLQISQGDSNRAKAEGNSVRLLTLSPDRGLITDVNGSILAQNSSQLALAINPQTMPGKYLDRQKVYSLLRDKAGISQDLIASIEKNRLESQETYPVKTNLTKDESLLYKEYFANIPGVVVQESPIRLYTNLPSVGHLLGYVGLVNDTDLKNHPEYGRDQQVGKTGVEQVYNSQLNGVAGKQKAEVNALGEIVRTLPGGDETQAKTGQSLRLSIDSKLQNIVATALKNELARRTLQYGPLPDLGASAVVLDPATGAVKAMVSLPDYNDQLFGQGISQTNYSKLLNDPGHPLLNRSIQAELPSGSVIKPFIAAGALQDGIITPETSVFTPASISIGPYTFPDWKFHGQTNLINGIAQSNDILFYYLGGGDPKGSIKGLGIERMNYYLAKFGLGATLGLDLPGEQGGLIADPAWKMKNIKEPWYIGDTYHSAIGQGYTLVTPLQMADATSAIANGGTVWQPQLGWSTIDSATNKETLLPHKAITKNFISAQNIETVRQGMRETVLTGSGKPLNSLTVTSAGKTGTAEFPYNGKILTHAWYTGFAPYDNPELVFSIVIEGGGESFYSSLPVAEEILRTYFNDPLKPGQKLNSEPDLSKLTDFQGEH